MKKRRAATSVALLSLLLSAGPSVAQTLPLPPGTEPTPPSLPNTATKLPPVGTGSPVNAAELEALRARYDDLRARQAAAEQLNGPVTDETRNKLETHTAKLAAINDTLPLETWKADSLEAFMNNMQARAPLVLPDQTPPDLTTDLHMAVIPAGTKLLSAPSPDQQFVLQTTEGQQPVLQIARATPYSLVWVHDAGFAFVLIQSLRVYR